MQGVGSRRAHEVKLPITRKPLKEILLLLFWHLGALAPHKIAELLFVRSIVVRYLKTSYPIR